MKEEKTNIIKKYFLNIKPVLYIIILIVTIYLSLKETKLLFAFGLLIIVGIIYITSFFAERNTINKIYLYKSGEKKFLFKPYIISKEELLDEIKNYGIPITFIEINKKIYSIEVGKNKEKYICYLDNIEFNSIDEFINYNIDNTTIDKQKKIKILAYNYQDPSILKNR